jgi:hypothetical protein
MTRLTLKLTCKGEPGTPQVFERSVDVDVPSNITGEESLGEDLSSELATQIALGDFYDSLPDVSGIRTVGEQTFTLDDIRTSSYFYRRNTRWMWFEISQTLLHAKFLFARARAYKSIEPPRRDVRAENIALYNIHHNKMDAFDLAVHGLAKIEDLFLRLIFENLGGTLVEVDLTQPGWERYLTLDRIMDSALHAFGSRQPPSKPGRPHWTFILLRFA